MTTTCAYTTCTRPAKPGGRFCSPRCRAAWNRENGGVVPARVQSHSLTQNGDTVLVLRVRGEDSHRVADWAPKKGVELLEGKE